jgi:hypothetical protein
LGRVLGLHAGQTARGLPSGKGPQRAAPRAPPGGAALGRAPTAPCSAWASCGAGEVPLTRSEPTRRSSSAPRTS